MHVAALRQPARVASALRLLEHRRFQLVALQELVELGAVALRHLTDTYDPTSVRKAFYEELSQDFEVTLKGAMVSELVWIEEMNQLEEQVQ